MAEQKIAVKVLSGKGEANVANILRGLEKLQLRDGKVLNYGFGSIDCGATHNSYVFHSSGFQLIAAADLSLKDIEGIAKLSGMHHATLFVLGEHPGSSIPDKDIVPVAIRSAALRELAVWKQAPVFESQNRRGDGTNLASGDYLENNAVFKINEGECLGRNLNRGEAEWTVKSWEEFRAWRMGKPLSQVARDQ